jgi:cholesterol oxidase
MSPQTTEGPEQFDVVIVGSGFGGAVMAYELACRGLSVCVLERGKAYPPGSFPRSPLEVARNFWDPSLGHHGMFDLWSLKNLDAVVSSGLGGGSLIYANVLMRMPRAWFDGQHWPIPYHELEQDYKAVERRLGAVPFPATLAPSIRKLREFRDAARGAGYTELEPAPLAVTFADPARDPHAVGYFFDDGNHNLHGLPRHTCRLCGECDVGCNQGSKNSLDLTYLSDALRCGATIRTRCEVRGIAPVSRDPGGPRPYRYRVTYVSHGKAPEGVPLQTYGEDAAPHLTPREIIADQLVLAAGSLGSTFLLLRSRAVFPGLSHALGTRFCGNGDRIVFLAPNRHGSRTAPASVERFLGPVITTIATRPGARESSQGRQHILEDGGYPLLANWLFPLVNARHWITARDGLFKAVRLLSELGRRPKRSDTGEELVRTLLNFYSHVPELVPILAMGQDSPDGRLTLASGTENWADLEGDWRAAGESANYFAGLGQGLERLAAAARSKLRDWPLGRFNREITVHPLGGCPMGHSAATGVVDGYGEVFEYPGFFIADGSVLPMPTGANPALTIAALSRRFSRRVLDNQNGDK